MQQILHTHVNPNPWPKSEHHITFARKHFIGAKPCEQDAEVLSIAINHAITSGRKGLWLEFGTGRGDSTKYICDRLKEKNEENPILHTFDSGEGLPEDWRKNFPQGTFAWEKGKIPDLPKNSELHVGLFEQSLPDFILEHRDTLEKDGIAFLSIDCDLYSSTKTIFDALAPYLNKETVVFFDELYNYEGFENHEWKAWTEYLEPRTAVQEIEYLGYNVNQAQVASLVRPINI